MLLPEEDMSGYRQYPFRKVGRQDARGWRYLYQEGYLTSWAMINDKWYFFGTDSYMKTGWQEYKDQWYYLSPDNRRLDQLHHRWAIR